MSFVHHPAFQSLVLPAVLAWLAAAGGWALPAGRPWAALGGVVALLLAFAVLPGWQWPATSGALRLPWIVGASGLAVAAASAGALARGRSARAAAWLAAALCWVAATMWLAGGRLAPGAAASAALAGAAVLALLAWASGVPPSGSAWPVALPGPDPAADNGAPAAAGLVMASLGLAALGGAGGSLLLAQLALMLATVTAVPGLWAWLRPRAGRVVTPVLLLPLGIGWLAMATTLHQRSGVGTGPLALLALGFAAPLLARHRVLARRPRWTPLAAALLAALPMACAIAWHVGTAGAAVPDGARGGASDDPYYVPQWK